jgi:hypothetical protein
MAHILLAVILILMGVSATFTQTVRAAPVGAEPNAPPNPFSSKVYWVNDPGDSPDATPGNGVCNTSAGNYPHPPLGTGRTRCTLRAAIQEANLDGVPSVIAFEICPSDYESGLDGSYAIYPRTPLPAITEPSTYINGYTQGYPQETAGYDDPGLPPGSCQTTPPVNYRIAEANTNRFSGALNTVLGIAVDGFWCVPPAPAAGDTTDVPGGIVPSGSILRWNGTAGACSGLTLTSDRTVIAGLNIRSWKNAGVLIMPMTSAQADKPSENVIWGNFIGTDIQGASAQGDRFGIEIIGGSQTNFIGETIAIGTWGLTTQGWVEQPTNNERNLISGNDNPYRVYGFSCTDPGFGNFYEDGAGVFMGLDSCIRVSGSLQAGYFTGGAIDNVVRNSYIGANYTGSAAIPNTNGVWLNYDAGADTVGGVDYPGNHIGGCVKFPFTPGSLGVGECYPQTVDYQQDPNLISGNRRRSNQNGGHGVWINGAPDGLLVSGVHDVDYNEIGGNFIGTNANGMASLPNSGDGVYLLANTRPEYAPHYNEIGATTEFVPGAFNVQAPFTHYDYRYGNLISGNGNDQDQLDSFTRYDNGIEIRGAGASYNRVGYGNVIGLNSQGTASLGNGDNGVYIRDQATINYVHNNSGGNISSPYAPAADDLVSAFGAISQNGNFSNALGRHGVRIAANSTYNHIFRNCIGGNGSDCGGTAFGNAHSGVTIDDNSRYNFTGLYELTSPSDQRNWIHHNGWDSISVVDDTSVYNEIRFNSIWLNNGLGIDLGHNGVTPNGSGPVGPNHFQDYPYDLGGSSPWNVTFTSCSTCIVDIYATLVSESDYPSNGEGRYWLQAASGSGSPQTVNIAARITAVFGGLPAENVCVSLTATNASTSPDYNHDTSEFSPCIRYIPTAITLASLTAHTASFNNAFILLVALILLGCGGVTIIGLRRRR